MIRGILAAVIALLLPALALAQGTVQQLGPVTPSHPAVWVQNGQIADAATFSFPITTFTLGATAQVGTGATIVCAAGHVCDSFSGTVTLVTGTGTLSAGTTAAPDFTITFPFTRANTPNCIVGVIATGGSTGVNFPVHAETPASLTVATTGALTASTTYSQSYSCNGY